MHTVRLCDDILSVSKVMLSVSERKIIKFIGLNTVGEMKAAVWFDLLPCHMHGEAEKLVSVFTVLWTVTVQYIWTLFCLVMLGSASVYKFVSVYIVFAKGIFKESTCLAERESKCIT
jgi:hypothetical protein